MAEQTIKSISLANLIIDLFNPRHISQPSQREALATIALDQGIKLVNLAEDIVDKGLNPSELPLVAAADQDGMYVVLEGNRRIAALKLMASPQLLASFGLPKKLTERYKALHMNAGSILPALINCAVLSREDANHWIQLKHTGENDGVGIVGWDGRARQRFRGSSPALQAIELVEESDYIDDETKNNLAKISITNVERLLGTPEARKALGVDVKNNQLIIVAAEQEVLGRLAIVVSEVANKKIKVTDLDSKEQRVAYAQKVATMPLPMPVRGTGTGGTPGASPVKPGSGRRINPDRKTLIPRTLKLTIPHARLNRIYHELQKIRVDHYVNCCAVMFRVFIELSVDHYAQQKKLSLMTTPKAKAGASLPRPKVMSLREKITAVANHLEQDSICNKGQLRGIRSLTANRLHVLSVDGLNAYVHNKDYNPTATDLKANWDSVQPFVQGLWTV
jgi:hypothetical protein